VGRRRNRPLIGRRSLQLSLHRNRMYNSEVPTSPVRKAIAAALSSAVIGLLGGALFGLSYNFGDTAGSSPYPGRPLDFRAVMLWGWCLGLIAGPLLSRSIERFAVGWRDQQRVILSLTLVICLSCGLPSGFFGLPLIGLVGVTSLGTISSRVLSRTHALAAPLTPSEQEGLTVVDIFVLAGVAVPSFLIMA